MTIDLSAAERLRHRLALRTLLDHRRFGSASLVERKQRATADHYVEPERIAGSRWKRLGDSDWVRVQ